MDAISGDLRGLSSTRKALDEAVGANSSSDHERHTEVFPVCGAGHDADLRKQEKLQLRLDAEASIGVSAALIGGFALSLIPEARSMEPSADDVSGGTVSSLFRRDFFVLAMALAGSLALFALVVSGSVYWAGKHLLSATCKTVAAENDLFRRWWKLPKSQRARWMSRRAFELSMPVFLAGITALVADVVGGHSGKGPGNAGEASWLVGVVIALFAGLLLVALPLTRGIEGYVTEQTATA